MQNTETVSDIRAIRNAVSHASFGIKKHGENNEYVVDFQGGLSGFAFDRKYTGKQLLEIYSAYDDSQKLSRIADTNRSSQGDLKNILCHDTVRRLASTLHRLIRIRYRICMIE